MYICIELLYWKSFLNVITFFNNIISKYNTFQLGLRAFDEFNILFSPFASQIHKSFVFNSHNSLKSQSERYPEPLKLRAATFHFQKQAHLAMLISLEEKKETLKVSLASEIVCIPNKHSKSALPRYSKTNRNPRRRFLYTYTHNSRMFASIYLANLIFDLSLVRKTHIHRYIYITRFFWYFLSRDVETHRRENKLARKISILPA